MKRLALLVAVALAGAACTNSTAPKAKTTAAPKPLTWVCSVNGTGPAASHFSETFSENLYIARGDLKIDNRNLDWVFGLLPEQGGYPHGSSERHVTLACSTVRP